MKGMGSKQWVGEPMGGADKKQCPFKTKGAIGIIYLMYEASNLKHAQRLAYDLHQ